MFRLKYPVEQTDPPRSPRETLPTMYDLPSEDPEELGLPDEFHDLQPQLLSRTCRSPRWSPQRMFTGTDINLYYDVRHSRWYKRPDWFLVVDVPRLYDENDLRLSYVIWQEGIAPLVVVELLSPGTEAEDLGENVRTEDIIQTSPSELQQHEETATQSLESERAGNNLQQQDEEVLEQQQKEKPPRKWEVYEQILRVPYYITFSRYTNQVRAFTLVAESYQELVLDPNQPQIWIPALQLGLGLWQGEFEGIERLWLRWYDVEGNWIPTDVEQERQEKELALQRAEQEARRAAEATRQAQKANQRAAEANQRAAEAEALLERSRQEKEQLLERLRQLEGQ